MNHVPAMGEMILVERDDEHIEHLCSDGFNVDDLGFEGFGNYNELNEGQMRRLVVHIYIPAMNTVTSIGVKDNARLTKVFKHFENKYGNSVEGSIRLYVGNLQVQRNQYVRDVGIIDESVVMCHFPGNDPIERANLRDAAMEASTSRQNP